MAEKYLVSASPHVRDSETTARIMWIVTLTLVPSALFSIAMFGYWALLVMICSTAAAVGTEFVIQKYLRKRPVTISDGSAFLTGILLAFTIPPNVPLYVPVVGAIFAIAIAKHAFGGLGMNIWNPALAGRAFLLSAYSGLIVMSKWPLAKKSFFGNIRVDAVTQATPLQVMKKTPQLFAEQYSTMDLFLGKIPGSLGETCALLLLIGGIVLIVKKYIDWRLPLAFIGTVALLTWILPLRLPNGTFTSWCSGNPILHVFGGGLMLGAFYMATDMVTSPMTSKGQIIFGLGCGILVAVIRLYGGFPEGVCYAILIMNTAVPLIDRYTKPRLFGTKKTAKNAA